MYVQSWKKPRKNVCATVLSTQYGSVARWNPCHCCFERCETQSGTLGKQEWTQTLFAGDSVTIRWWYISHTVPLTPEHSQTAEATRFFRCSNSLSWGRGSERWPSQAMLGGILQPPEPKLLISRAQGRRRLRLDAAAPTYRHAVFCNPLPQVIYSNTDSADSGARVPPHYAVTQTGLFALLLQIRRTCMTSPGGGVCVARALLWSWGRVDTSRWEGLAV